MKLHENAGLPSPRRVRMFLAEKGIEVDRKSVV
jgi:glutathione S-transferase